MAQPENAFLGAVIRDGANTLGRGMARFVERADSWFNLATGFGTSKDKTEQGGFAANITLPDVMLSALYAHNHLARKIVDVYPREAFREGFGVKGVDADRIHDVADYLESLELGPVFVDAWVWARLFGGAAIWLGVDDGISPDLPMDEIRGVDFLKVIDKRYLQIKTRYREGPKVGKPETWWVTDVTNTYRLGTIHETRLVLFPGARTDAQERLRLNGWDHSILQATYDAMQSDGNVWKAIELLVQDGNQGIYKIKNFFAMLAGDREQELIKRLQLMDLTRSVGRAVALDAEHESFERLNQAFAGLPELTDRAMKRVASAAEIPVTVLLGEAPAGLNATGNSDLRWFWGRIGADQRDVITPRLQRVLRVVLRPLLRDAVSKVRATFPPLWAPTSTELATMRLQYAQEAQILVQNEIALPEEIALSRYVDEFGDIRVDAEKRRLALEIQENESDNVGGVEVTPSALESAITVNEIRRIKGFAPLTDPDGNLSIAEYRTKKEQAAAAGVVTDAVNALDGIDLSATIRVKATVLLSWAKRG